MDRTSADTVDYTDTPGLLVPGGRSGALGDRGDRMTKPLAVPGLAMACAVVALTLAACGDAANPADRAREPAPDCGAAPAPTMEGSCGRSTVYRKTGATWCSACPEQVPHLERSFERLTKSIRQHGHS